MWKPRVRAGVPRRRLPALPDRCRHHELPLRRAFAARARCSGAHQLFGSTPHVRGPVRQAFAMRACVHTAVPCRQVWRVHRAGHAHLHVRVYARDSAVLARQELCAPESGGLGGSGGGARPRMPASVQRPALVRPPPLHEALLPVCQPGPGCPPVPAHVQEAARLQAPPLLEPLPPRQVSALPGGFLRREGLLLWQDHSLSADPLWSSAADVSLPMCQDRRLRPPAAAPLSLREGVPCYSRMCRAGTQDMLWWP
mmetsp:Transcript_20300/g.77716  ORF Transcript_20300/g.77716 Transcript_20300/m.77716 type:complete len:254 (-) Transcript_20300:1210-1971(-)